MKNLKDRRKRLGLTQDAMAELVGVPKGTYVNWEMERANPPKLSRDRITQVLETLEDGGKVNLSLPISDKVRRHLDHMAKVNGTSIEEEAARILESIFLPEVKHDGPNGRE